MTWPATWTEPSASTSAALNGLLVSKNSATRKKICTKFRIAMPMLDSASVTEMRFHAM